MKHKIPEGATLLFTIRIDGNKAVSTPEADLAEVAEDLARKIGGYVEEHGKIPAFLEPWQDLANAVARHQCEERHRENS